MTKTPLILASVLCGSFLHLHAAAAETVTLECKYEKTYDFQTAVTSATTGTKLVVINVLEGKKIKLKKQDLGPEFTGLASDTNFQAEVSYSIGELTIREMIDINRYTGAFENTFGTSKGGLLHFGSCKPIQKKF